MTVAGPTGDLGGAAAERPRRTTAATGVWAVSLLVLGLVAISAAWRTLELLLALLGNFPRPYDFGGLLVVAGVCVGAAASVFVTRRLSTAPLVRGWRLPALVVLLAVAVRVIVAVAVDAPLRAENAIVSAQAVGVLDGACCFGHRPLGYPVALAGVYRVLGVGPLAVEALNLAFAAVTAWLVLDIGRVAWSRRVGVIAAAAYAVAPSQVLLVLVPLTEPMYTMLVAGAVRAGLSLGTRRMLVAASAIAIFVAAGQYVRATAASLLLPIVVLPWLVGWTVRRTAARGVVVGATALALLLPVVVYNVGTHGDLSVSTSAYGGWSLYVGANREHGGQWNAEDAARLTGFPGDSWWDRSEHSGGLALDRILEDPAGSLALLPRKFATLWADETYAATYALRGDRITRDVHVAWLATQVLWLVLVVLATLGVVTERRAPSAGTLLIGMLVTVVAAAHLLLEVHSRYHAYLVPLLCVLAAVGLEAPIGAWRGRRARPATV